MINWNFCLITIEQLRAARGLLGWSQSELAFRAGLSVPTVRRVEAGSGPRVSDEAREKLQQALEAAGIEFIEENSGGAGVRFEKPKRSKRTSEPATVMVGSRPSSVLKVSNRPGGESIPKVSVRQIKAARALLDWPQEHLAEAAGLSIPTIKRLEAQDGPLRGRSNTGQRIFAALEKAGIEFIDENGGGPGVRLRKSPKKPRDS
jgi:transcriptional regulator with XRE-family HTH domain